MISLTKKRDQQGFTIVELLIVIVVIGILAALVVTTYAGIQAKARDSKRKTDIASIQTQVEAYYAEANEYPSNANMNSSTWRAANMKSLKDDTITDPSGTTAGFVNDLATREDQQYGYIQTDDAGAACTANCTGYSLTAALEGSDEIYTKTALD